MWNLIRSSEYKQKFALPCDKKLLQLMRELAHSLHPMSSTTIAFQDSNKQIGHTNQQSDHDFHARLCVITNASSVVVYCEHVHS